MALELGCQRDEIELTASENIVSRAVLEAQDSVLTNKYAGAAAANRVLAEQRIRARGAIAVFVPVKSIVGPESDASPAWIHGDPHRHYTPQSHARIAAAISPQSDRST